MRQSGKETQPILFTGGGTLGPVTPLLAIFEAWKQTEPDASFAWIGTPGGPEAELVKARRIPFFKLRTPKLHRHKKWTWVFVPFLLLWSLFGAFRLMRKIKPRMVFTAGGYVSVPIVWMARLMGVPVWVHQLDVEAGVANKVMAPAATRISVTFESSLKDYGHDKTFVVGGVVRSSMEQGSAEVARKAFKLSKGKPTLLVLGGGTGAVQINNALSVMGKELEKRMNVIHLTGIGKLEKKLTSIGGNYCVVEFLNKEMADAYAVADGVVARAGMGTLLEIAKLRKPSLLIPISGSHQVANARVFEEHDAAEVVYRVNPQILKQRIEHLIFDESRKEEIKANIRGFLANDGAKQIVQNAKRILVHWEK